MTAMPFKISLFILTALMVSCTTTDYLGRTYPPTQHVDVFFSPQDVKRTYEVMGEIRAEGDDIVSYERCRKTDARSDAERRRCNPDRKT